MFFGKRRESTMNTMYLEPVCPLFWWLNPPKQGLFQSKQGSFGFQVYAMTWNVLHRHSFRIKLGPSWRAENGNPQYVAYIFVHVISGWNPAQLNYVDK